MLFVGSFGVCVDGLQDLGEGVGALGDGFGKGVVGIFEGAVVVGVAANAFAMFSSEGFCMSAWFFVVGFAVFFFEGFAFGGFFALLHLLGEYFGVFAAAYVVGFGCVVVSSGGCWLVGAVRGACGVVGIRPEVVCVHGFYATGCGCWRLASFMGWVVITLPDRSW